MTGVACDDELQTDHCLDGYRIEIFGDARLLGTLSGATTGGYHCEP